MSILQRPAVSTRPAKGEEETQALGVRLFALLAALDEDLHPGHTFQRELSFDSSLEGDLGIDSLGRVELLVRIEREFDVDLPAKTYTEVETPGDLIQLILSAKSRTAEPLSTELLPPDSTGDVSMPLRAQTLQEALIWHFEQHPDRTHMLLYEEQGEVTPLSYGELFTGAQSAAYGLSDAGLERGRTVAIMLPTGRDYFTTFFGVLMIGAIPVPIYPPARPSQIEDHLRRHSRILENADCGVLVTSREIAAVAHLLKAQVPAIRQVVTAEALREPVGSFAPAKGRSEDIAFLQYTSGSTGDPKGVKLTHFNLLSNIRAMGEITRVDARDVFVSWLPLYHDMGLIGAWLGSLYHACPLVAMSPLAFLSRPSRWLRAIGRHGGTLSAAPNFAYELCLSKVHDEDIEGLDLSSWRMAFNGAEPVSPRTIERFTRRFEAYGFRPEAMAPVYGLAESSVGLAFPPSARPPPVDRVDRSLLETEGRALPVVEAGPDPLEVVACGQPLRGHQIRIVDDRGRELPERRVGRLQFQGPSATSGYFRNPEATAKLFDGPWLESGDLAYIAGGDIYITSRLKDMIVRAGRNIYPHELEEAVGEIDGVRKGCVAVFGVRDPREGTERLVVLAETRETDEARRTELREEIQMASIDLTGTSADEVVLALPHAVLKTSSGKVRRAACRERYEQGLLKPQDRPLALQILRIGVSLLKPEWTRFKRLLAAHSYALYAWCLFGAMAPVVWMLVAILPTRSARWHLIRGAARLIIRLAGLEFRVRGEGSLSEDRPVVLVANHASYLDGLLLVAALPIPLVFVAKKEFQKKLIPATFLRRVGTIFVERFDSRRASDDLGRLRSAAHEGNSLLFFPEGTFSRMPGLLAFRAGAFVTSAGSDLPVVPVAIQGSRSLLRAESWFPRRVDISIDVLPPVRAEGGDFNAALELRDRVRSLLLHACGEPDLAGETYVPPKRGGGE